MSGARALARSAVACSSRPLASCPQATRPLAAPAAAAVAIAARARARAAVVACTHGALAPVAVGRRAVALPFRCHGQLASSSLRRLGGAWSRTTLRPRGRWVSCSSSHGNGVPSGAPVTRASLAEQDDEQQQAAAKRLAICPRLEPRPTNATCHTMRGSCSDRSAPPAHARTAATLPVTLPAVRHTLSRRASSRRCCDSAARISPSVRPSSARGPRPPLRAAPVGLRVAGLGACRAAGSCLCAVA